MSFFDRQGIHEDLLRSKSNIANAHLPAGDVQDEFENDILPLRDYSFITITTDKKTFEMHSLMQLAMRKWLEGQEKLDIWRERFISNLCTQLPSGEYENQEKCLALCPHTKTTMAQRPERQKSVEEWALLLHNAAWYAVRRGKAADAEDMSVMSMEARKVAFGEEDARTLGSMNMVGQAWELGGRYGRQKR